MVSTVGKSMLGMGLEVENLLGFRSKGTRGKAPRSWWYFNI